jgi:hypothetical protein
VVSVLAVPAAVVPLIALPSRRAAPPPSRG